MTTTTTLHYQPPKEFMRVIGGSILLHVVVIALGLILLNYTPKRDFLTPVYSVSLIAPEKKVRAKPVVKAAPIKVAPVKATPIKTKTVKIKTETKKPEAAKIAAIKEKAETQKRQIESAVENIKRNITRREERSLVAAKITELDARKKAEEQEIQTRLAAISSSLVFKDEQEKETPDLATQGLGTASPEASTEPLGMEASLYLSFLRDQVQSEWSYPEVMRTRDLSVIVSIKIDRAGQLVKLKVEKSSGNPRFDDSLLRAVKKAAPFNPLPESIKGSHFETGLRFCPTCK
jgi:colicin import membrane protein